jgi:hypothetical protein
MATSRELKALLRPLLARRSDLGFVGRTLFFQPFTHYLRGVAFTASLYSSTSQGFSFAHQLYNGQESVDFIGTSGQHKYLLLSDWKENPDTASANLCDDMERRALPPVEPIVDYVEHQKAPAYIGAYNHRAPNYVFLVALGECSVGAFDAAEAKLSDCERHLPDYSAAAATEEHRYSGYTFWRMAYLLRKLRKDREHVLPLLHDWEAYSVRRQKLTKYWNATPFTAEL